MERSYYAILPAEIRYDKNINTNAKLLYAEITALCNEKGFCWATNKYFCDLYQVDLRTVQRWLKALEKAKYISLEITYFEGTKQVKSRGISLYTPHGKNATTPHDNFVTTPHGKSAMENNNIYNNKQKETIKEKAQEVLDKLNSEIGSSFKLTSEIEKLVDSLFAQGYLQEDIFNVIEKKSKEWLNTSYAKYLRPLTLFGSKFDTYLNERICKPKEDPREAMQNHNYSKEYWDAKMIKSYEDWEIK